MADDLRGGTVHLVGRDDELRRIRDAFDGTAIGGRVMLIVGDPGVGKSALVAAAAEEAAMRGMLVLSAFGSEAEQHLPFSALFELIRPILDRASDLPPGHRGALLGALGLSAEGAAREPLFIALATLELIADVSTERAVVIVVDDLQWIDPPSRDVIDFVARRLDGEATVMLVCVRTNRADPAAYPGATTMQISGLGIDAARRLLHEKGHGLSPADEGRILLIADGNPLALLELPLSLAEQDGKGSRVGVGSVPLTKDLERAFADRIDELDPEVQSLMLVAALQGSDQFSETLAATGELLGRPLTASAFDSAAAAGLIKIDFTAFRFRHPLVRSAIAQRSTEGDRISAHRALAQASAGDPDRMAWHRAMAALEPHNEVAQALEEGADRVLSRGAPSLAAEWLERSADLSEDQSRRARRLLRAAELAFELGRASAVRELTAQARALPLDQVDFARLAGLEGAFDDGVPGDVDHVRRLVQAAERARGEGEEGLAAQLLVGASMTCYWGGAEETVRSLVRNAASKLRLPDVDPRAIVLRAVIDPYRDGAELMDHLLWWAERDTPDPAVSAALGRAGFAVGDFDRALLFARRASDTFRQQGRVALLAQTLVLETYSALYLGRWDVTQVASAEAHRFGVETEQPVWAACAQLGQANLAGLQGRRLEAEELASSIERIAALNGNRSLLNAVQLTRGLAALGDEAPEDAFTQFARMMDSSDPAYQTPQSVWALDQFADAAALTGRVEEARAVLREFEVLTADATAPGVRRAVALARLHLEDDAGLDARFREARTFAASASPWYRGRLDLALGSWLRRHRRIAESRDVLRSAQAVFDALGAAAWTARAERELRAAGQRPQHTDRDGWLKLSAQELQIAQLAAEGLSNREIGGRLYLSHRTVGSHLYRIYPKLGIRTRAQLHSALGSDRVPVTV